MHYQRIHMPKNVNYTHVQWSDLMDYRSLFLYWSDAVSLTLSFAQISYIESHRYHRGCAEESTGQEQKIYSHPWWENIAGIQFQPSSTKHETNSGPRCLLTR